jgi:hypothetical protein
MKAFKCVLCGCGVKGFAALTISLLLSVSSSFAQQANTLDTLMLSYGQARQKIETEAVNTYSNALAIVGTQLKQKGDVDGYLLLDAEKKRLALENTIDAGTTNITPAIADVAKSAVAGRNAKMAVLLRQYADRLDRLVKQLLVSDKIVEAKAAKEAMDTAKQLIDELAIRRMPAEGLIAYYPFNGNATDESGHGHNGIVHGVSLSADRFNNDNSAYSFNGENNYISADIGKYSTLSVSVWIYPQSPKQWYPLVVKYAQYGLIGLAGNHPFYIRDSKVGQCSMHDNPNQSGILSVDHWHHVVATYDSKTSKSCSLYVDGILIGSNKPTKPLDPKSSIMLFGNTETGRSSDGGAGFNGLIDDIRIYNRVLSDSEVTTLFNEKIQKSTK